MPDRFFCPDLLTGERVTLEGDEARHLVRVRRVPVGAAVEVFDGKGAARTAVVVAIARDLVELKTIGPPLPDRALDCSLALATAVPKGDRFDSLVEKATELGVARLIPILTARSVVDPRAAKLDRLRRVVIEASKQCGRNRLMTLDRPTPWPEVVAAPGPTLRLLAHPGGLAPPAWPGLVAGELAIVAIGPEGGFTDEEVETASAAGWVTVGLGPTLLRIETAGLAACSILMARRSNLNHEDK